MRQCKFIRPDMDLSDFTSIESDGERGVFHQLIKDYDPDAKEVVTKALIERSNGEMVVIWPTFMKFEDTVRDEIHSRLLSMGVSVDVIDKALDGFF